MFLLMDTNIIIEDFFLNSVEFQKIKQHSEKLGIKLFVSSVVFDEVVQKYKEKLLYFNKKNKEFYYVPSDYLKIIPENQMQILVEKYKHRLHNELFKFNSLGTRRYEYDDIDFRHIYNKAINKIIPFNSSDKGFKDAMIWEQVKRIIEIYCDEQRKLAFITNNISDYYGVEKKQSDTVWYYPAFELRKEYMDKGYPEDTVRIYPSLKSFYLDIIVGKILKFDEYIEKLNTSLNEELKLSILNGIISQEESALEYSKKIKAILKAKAIAGFNSYGAATNENISILCKVEFLLETNLIEMEDIYVHVDLNERKVIYVE